MENKYMNRTLIILALIGLMAAAWYGSNLLNKPIQAEEAPMDMWIPTPEDIAYQDSMYSIIERTSMDVDTIKVAIDHILYKLDRLEYSDGTWDSIRVQIK